MKIIKLNKNTIGIFFTDQSPMETYLNNRAYFFIEDYFSSRIVSAFSEDEEGFSEAVELFMDLVHLLEIGEIFKVNEKIELILRGAK